MRYAAGQEQGKFVATDAGDEISFAEAVLHPFGRVPQRGVADVVAAASR